MFSFNFRKTSARDYQRRLLRPPPTDSVTLHVGNDYAMWAPITAERKMLPTSQRNGCRHQTESSPYPYDAGDVGVLQDCSEAFFWLDVAASGMVERNKRNEAVKGRDEAVSHLTSAEQVRVQERVRQWLENHPAKAL
jgi:hypothetical protein